MPNYGRGGQRESATPATDAPPATGLTAGASGPAEASGGTPWIEALRRRRGDPVSHCGTNGCDVAWSTCGMARALLSNGVDCITLVEEDPMSGGPEGLRAAGHALLYWQRRQEVNTHNLANADTAGFRARRVFAEMLEGGIPTVGTRTDTRVGELRQTGAPLDLALAGEGNFVVQTPNGEKLVRSGSFTLDPEGQIIDAAGNPLLGTTGPLVVPPGPVGIDARGGVTVDGEQVGRLRIVGEAVSTQPLPGEEVLPGDRGSGEGDPIRASGRGAGPDEIPDELPDEMITVRQGYLEESNVSALDSLIEMTTIQRSFEAVQTSVRTLDSIMETVANRIGRVD